MTKRIGLMLCAFLFLMTGKANNVRVVGNVNVDAGSISEPFVWIKLTLEWENSWRDSYNHDAVYLVLKYRDKRDKSQVWKHIYLEDDGHTADNGFTYSMAPGTTAGKNVGIFIHRSSVGSGIARTNLTLKWNYLACGIGGGNLVIGDIIASCTGIEMVYIPRGAFALGDKAYTTDRAASLRTFCQKDMYIPEAYDLVSDRYLITSSLSSVVEGHEPVLAANRMNDLSSNGVNTTNAWVPALDDVMLWTIDFCMLADSTELTRDSMRSVQYIGIESIPGYAPNSWTLLAAKEDKTGAWLTLYTGTAADWSTSLERVYPVTKAVKITSGLDKYRYYRIMINRSDMPSGRRPVIKSISMTERDLENDFDYTFVVDNNATLPLGGTRGLSAHNDVEEWTSGTLPATYPTGYKAFYVMKYEMTQEQYAGFLQLLPPESQRARTIGDSLMKLERGAYIFGNTDRVNARNGIIVSGWNEARDTASFGCDLDPSDAAVSMDGDGMPIACNYLTPADMLAYASWIGLRPLSELEYERMSRPPFPALPLPGSCAWGTAQAEIPVNLTEAGKSNESFASGNANFRDAVEGPVRAGIFATDKTDRVAAGASFWGVMELSGNLSEIYYNANVAGRRFSISGNNAYGNGVLPVNGISNISGWVSNDPNAFALRGGNFHSASVGDLATSLRVNAQGKITDINHRDSTVTFRLGRSVPDGPALPNILTLQNGTTTAEGIAVDTLCDGGDYTIVGNEPPGNYLVHYLWYKSENQGKTWELLREPSATGRDLTVKGLRNTGLADNVLREYWFKRLVIRDNSDGMSEVVQLKVVNPTYTVSRYRDTLAAYGTGAGITVTAKYTTTYEWSYLGAGKTLTADETTDLSSRYIPKKLDLALPNEGPLHGVKYIMVKSKILGRCERSDVIPVDVSNVLNKQQMYVKNYGSYRAWGDGCYAPSAAAYRYPTGGYEYRGDVGNGVYRIDPDGRSGPIEPFDVYCDMEAEDGPWMLVLKGASNSTHFAYSNASWTTNNTFGTISNETVEENIDYKNMAFATIPVKGVRLEVAVLGNRVAWNTPNNAKTLLELMTGSGLRFSPLLTAAQMSAIYAAAGMTVAASVLNRSGSMTDGINVNTGNGYGDRWRIGTFWNNGTSAGDVDHGFGLGLYDGGSCNPQASGFHEKGAQVWVWIK